MTFPLKDENDRAHANHRKTELEIVPDGFTVGVQGMRVGSAVHFSLDLLLQIPCRGYMPLYLLPPFAVYSGTPQFAAEIHCSHNLYALLPNTKKCNTNHHVERRLNYGVI